MAYSTRTEKTKTGKFAARTMTGAYGRGYTVHLTEEFATAAEAYAAADAWKKEQAAANASKKAEKNKAQMTCQCCGRMQMANTGKLAHHGYTVDHGFFNGTCLGARELPFEVSRERLGEHIAAMRDLFARKVEHRTNIDLEAIAISEGFENRTKPTYKDNRGRQKYETTYVEFTAATFEAVRAQVMEFTNRRASVEYSWEDLKRNTLRQLDASIKNLTDYINGQQARYDGWKQTHSGFDKASGTWIKI